MKRERERALISRDEITASVEEGRKEGRKEEERESGLTFVALDEVAFAANVVYRRVPADAQLGTLDIGDPDVTHEAGHAGLGGDGYVDVLGLAYQRRDSILREHLEAVGRHRV